MNIWYICFLIVKLVGWNILFYADTLNIFNSVSRLELPRNIWSGRLPFQFIGVLILSDFIKSKLRFVFVPLGGQTLTFGNVIFEMG